LFLVFPFSLFLIPFLSYRGPVQSPTLFPIFLKLEGRRVLLVGGGAVATSKLPALLDAGADVTVVSPTVTDTIAQARVHIEHRQFRASDIDPAWLVIAAATPAVNRQVARTAAGQRVFVNAVDDPENASAYLGGVLRRGGVTVAISTDGRSPALAGLLREGLDALLPPDLDRWSATALEERRRWKEHGVPMPHRRSQLLEALNALYAEKAGRP
jgi:uroporphyrin-III C-methyltransferase/precorrin-2 dehydrogenase/sirohydrochlorin ferrochelatase